MRHDCKCSRKSSVSSGEGPGIVVHIVIIRRFASDKNEPVIQKYLFNLGIWQERILVEKTWILKVSPINLVDCMAIGYCQFNMIVQVG